MSENITINLTQPQEEITFSYTEQGEEITFSFSEAARGPQGEPGSSVTVDQTIIDGSTNAVSGNAVFDGLALKAPIANPTFTGIVTAPRITGRCDGLEVLCKAGLAINAGQVVYVTGASGSNIIIGLAQANAEPTSSKTIGISESTLAHNATGYAITEGLMTVSISAPSAIEGDPIWLSPTTAGGMVFGLANKPSAPNHIVYLGVVTRKTGNTVVEIYVKIQNGAELDELADVAITSPAAGQALMRGASLWENRSIVSADISDATSAATPDVIVKRDSQGRAFFASTSNNAVTGTSTDGNGISGVSTNGNGLVGTSTNGVGAFISSTSGTGGTIQSSTGTGARTRTISGTNHHEFGTISGDDRSFVRRVLGLFGWHRGSFVQTLGSPATLTADSAIELPDIASGTVALTSDARFTDERAPTAAGLTSKFGTNKATIVDGDKVTILDSAASDAPKHVLWSLIVSTLTTAFNALYVGLTGNQTVAGDKTFSGQLELTGQAATNSTSAMSRALAGKEPFFNIGVVRNVIYPPAFANSGTTGAAAITVAGDRLFSITSGSVNSGWARASLARGVNSFPSASGSGIRFGKKVGVSIAFNFAMSSFTDVNNVFRLIVGSNQTPAADGADPITYRGFGVELKSRGTSHDWRLFAHNGTAISYSAWTNTGMAAFTPLASLTTLAVESDGTGNITGYLGLDCTRTLSTLTLTGGPTTSGTSAQSFIDVQVANSASGTQSLRCEGYDAKIYTE